MIPKGYISLRECRKRLLYLTDATGRIDAEISAGNLKVFLFHDADKAVEISPKAWKQKDKKAALALMPSLGPEDSEELVVKKVDFLTIFEEEFENSQLNLVNAVATFDEGRKRGAPIKIDWEKLWGEFAAHLLTLDKPPKPGEAIKYLQHLCTAELNCHEPSSSSIQRMLGPFYAALERRKRRVPINQK
jgi:hypothetical protein